MPDPLASGIHVHNLLQVVTPIIEVDDYNFIMGTKSLSAVLFDEWLHLPSRSPASYATSDSRVVILSPEILRYWGTFFGIFRR
jgi:hypothetical protein